MSKTKRQPIKAGAVFAVLYGISTLLGSTLQDKGYLCRPEPRTVTLSVAEGLIAFFLFVIVIGDSQTRFAAEAGRGRRQVTPERRGQKFSARRKESAALWLLFMTADLIILLGVYPGFFVYDAADELAMVQTRMFTTHHPLFHVLPLGFFLQLVHKLTGSYNAGIFLYLLLQAAVINAVFVFMLTELSRERREGRDQWFLPVTVLFLMFCPTVTMFVLCSTKDGLFGASLILMTISLRRIVKTPALLTGKNPWKTLYIVSSALMMLYRRNGVYAFAFAGIFLLIWSFRKKLFRQLLFCLLAALLLQWGVNTALAKAVGAKGGEHQEALSVPIMQLTRVYALDKDSLSVSDQRAFEGLFDTPVQDKYNPKLSDQVKLHFRNDVFDENPAKYASLWLRTGLSHPAAYLNAWLMTSYGYWYSSGMIDCYKGNTVYTFTYGDSSYFGYETEQPGTRHSFIPWIDRFYKEVSLNPAVQKLPVLHWLISPGALFWIWVFLSFGIVLRGSRTLLIPYLPVGAVFLTVLLGPCTLPRYVVYLWLGLPLLLWDFLYCRGRQGQ